MRTDQLQIRLLLLGLALATVGCSDAADESGEGGEHDDEAEHVADVVALDSAGMAAAGIELVAVDTVAMSRLPVTGRITFDQNRVSHIGPRTEGRVTALHVDLGSRVRPGQVLATLESPEVGATRADLHEAEALVRIARENYERERRLEAQGIASRRELLEAEAELRRQEAALLRAAERLQALGAGNGTGGQFAIAAPFAGDVVEKHATLGEVVNPSDQLFTVADLSRLWLELDIYERDLARIGRGQDVEVTTAAFPNRVFGGRIVYVGDIVDPSSRTVRARVELPNPDGALRPGMFATATITLSEGGAAVMVVPVAAIQEIEGRQVVFVPGDAPGEFRVQPVQVGASSEAGVIILSGLEPGDSVVTNGAFLLRSELAEGEIGEHGH
jgi:cobalt-zinc-cadmium efflux system membrane fusion protein